MTTAYVTHPNCLRHDMGPGHPESPDRLAVVNEAMRSSGLIDALRTRFGAAVIQKGRSL